MWARAMEDTFPFEEDRVQMRHRWVIISSLVALPLALFLIMGRQSSWRPRTLRVGASLFTLDFSSDDRTLIVGHRDSLWGSFSQKFQLWDVATGELQKTLPEAKSDSGAVVLSSDQSLVAAVVGAGVIKVWDVESGQMRRTLSHPPSTGLAISALAFSPDNRILAEGRGDEGLFVPPYPGQILLWDVRTGILRHTLNTGGNTVASFSFSPDGRTLIGSGMYAVQIWDVQSGSLRCKLKDKALLAPRLAFSSNGKTLATVAGRNIIEIWDPRTGALRHKLSRPLGNVSSIVLDSQGRTLASVSNGTGIPAPPLGTTSFSYSGPGVPINGEVSVWDARTGQHLRTLRNGGRAISLVAFSPDGQMLAASSDGEVIVWRSGTGEVLREIVSGSKTVTSLTFASDGRTLATGGDDQTVRLWRIQ